MRIVEFGLLNKQTGEIYDAELRLVKKSTGGMWMKLYQDAAKLLSEKKVRGSTLRIFFFLLGKAGYQNIIPNGSTTAKQIGMEQSAVYRAYGDLKKLGIILKKDNGYMLSPLICWKGTEKQFKQACYELFNTSRKELTDDR